MRRSMLTTACALGALAASTTPSHAWNTVVQRLQTVPNSTTAGSSLIQGDEWTFRGRAGQRVEIRMDTRDDTGTFESGLDAVLVLKKPGGDVIGYSDDPATCTVPPVCGFGCPVITATLPVNGVYTIVARDYDSASTTGTQCTGGSYLLTLRAVAATANSLSAAPSVDDGIVGDPPWLQGRLQSAKGQ